jgi:hypothetical protein
MSPSLRRFQQLTLNRWPACALLLVIASASASSRRCHPIRFDIINLFVIHPLLYRDENVPQSTHDEPTDWAWLMARDNSKDTSGAIDVAEDLRKDLYAAYTERARAGITRIT